MVDKAPTPDANLASQIPEQTPTRKKATKDKGLTKALKADKKQKQKHAHDSKFVSAKPSELQGQPDHQEINPLLMERSRDEIPEGFLSVQSQLASKDSFPYELLKTNQRSKSGMCGSKIGRKGGLTHFLVQFSPP